MKPVRFSEASYFGMCIDLFQETERLRGELMVAVEKGSRHQMVLFRQLQECLLKVREVGNTKLDVSAQMLDTVSLMGNSVGGKFGERERMRGLKLEGGG